MTYASVTYTTIGLSTVLAVLIADLFIFRTKLVTRRIFWVSYAIILFFQLVTNGMFTGFQIVKYDGEAIIGSTSPANSAPPFIGDGRIAFAPVEDLLFGFSIVLLTLVLWVFWGRRGIDRTPVSGPPIWRQTTD